MDDYEIDYEAKCPKCGHEGIHYRDCTNWCNEGYFDEYDDDPINFAPGERFLPCEECKGTGTEMWCPKCGENLSGVKLSQDETGDE